MQDFSQEVLGAVRFRIIKEIIFIAVFDNLPFIHEK